MVRFATYNLLDMYASDTADEQARYERVYEVIRSLDVDVLTVQEVIARSEGEQAVADVAGKRLARLGECIRPRICTGRSATRCAIRGAS